MNFPNNLIHIFKVKKSRGFKIGTPIIADKRSRLNGVYFAMFSSWLLIETVNIRQNLFGNLLA